MKKLHHEKIARSANSFKNLAFVASIEADSDLEKICKDHNINLINCKLLKMERKYAHPANLLEKIKDITRTDRKNSYLTIFSSRYSVKALLDIDNACTDIFKLLDNANPILCVGRKTMEQFDAAFQLIDQDTQLIQSIKNKIQVFDSMKDLIANLLSSKDINLQEKKIIFFRGEKTAYQIKKILPETTIEEQILYKMTRAELDPEIKHLLENLITSNSLQYVIFASAQNAQAFEKQFSNPQLKEKNIMAICMGEYTKTYLEQQGWNNIETSTLSHLPKLLEKDN